MSRLLEPYHFTNNEIYHCRQGPKRNEFTYFSPGLIIDVRREGQVVSELRKHFGSLIKFDGQDYLFGTQPDLLGRLHELLASKLADAYTYFSDDVEIILHTQPKVFNYAFNPVSFYYFVREGQLIATLCEVNNTFGERFCYWLSAEDLNNNRRWIKKSKLFFVSPFYKVEGHYLFRFDFDVDQGRVDIKYVPTEQRHSLITYLAWRKVVVLTRWSFLFQFGFSSALVIARIHWQAWRLFYRRVRLTHKPSPPTERLSYDH